jgi:cell wall-associated NlpC family hydrolase
VRLKAKPAMLALIVCGLASNRSSAQQQIQNSRSSMTQVSNENASEDPAPVAFATLTPDDGLSVIAAVLDSRLHLLAKRDCSHLVHAIYDRAGFPYTYARSSDLFAGTNEFQRIANPQPGDLVVWRGHVGIVINPAQQVFYSATRSGPEIDNYDAPYWKRRGQLRFYRYIKNHTARDAKDGFVLARQGK